MSEEESQPTPPAARVVKKGVRGQRAPRKKVIRKSVEETPARTHAAKPNLPTEEKSIPLFQEDSPPEVGQTQKIESESQADAPSLANREVNAEDITPPSEDSQESSHRARVQREPNDQRQGRNRQRSSNEGQQPARERDREEQPKRRLDSREIAEKAWEIYQGELEEEGVSLVDTRRGREIARRCLELAVAFCEERDRFLSGR